MAFDPNEARDAQGRWVADATSAIQKAASDKKGYKIGDKATAIVTVKSVPFPVKEERPVEVIGVEIDENGQEFYRAKITSGKQAGKIVYFNKNNIK